jgi:type IV secretion system protein VirB10
MSQPAEVQEKAPKPQGLLPKNVQSWLLIGLAFLMLAIMWLTGGKKPPTQTKTASSTPAQAPLEVNETKINELQTRIEELQRQQLVAQSALAQQTRLIGTAPQDSEQSQLQSVSGNPPDQRVEDPIQAERKRRAYVSLFASNVALTFRKPPAVAPTPEPEAPSSVPSLVPSGPDAPQVAQLLKEMQPNPTSSVPGALSTAAARNDSTETTHDPKEETKNPAAVSAGSANAATGKPFLLFEGTILETVLINRLDGQFAGPVECLLSTDVYSNDRQHLLIPAGSKLLGQTKKVDTFGQTRLAVVFHRMLMPDGYSVSLDQFKGLNQIGDTGLRDQVNNHYLRIFGVSLAIGALGAVGEAGTAGSLNASSSDLMRQGFAQSTAQSSAQILEKFLNIMPTVTIREGHRVKVYLSGDLALPDYNNHTMPSDL